MRLALSAVLLAALAQGARAAGEGEENEAMPALLPTSGITVFYKSAGPLSFVTMTPRDVPKGAPELGEVKGVSCQRGLSIPLSADVRSTSVSASYGDGSALKAIENIKKAKPEVFGVYDVRMDLRVFSVLGIYRTLCTEITARAFGRPPA